MKKKIFAFLLIVGLLFVTGMPVFAEHPPGNDQITYENAIITISAVEFAGAADVNQIVILPSGLNATSNGPDCIYTIALGTVHSGDQLYNVSQSTDMTIPAPDLLCAITSQRHTAYGGFEITTQAYNDWKITTVIDNKLNAV